MTHEDNRNFSDRHISEFCTGDDLLSSLGSSVFNEDGTKSQSGYEASLSSNAMSVCSSIRRKKVYSKNKNTVKNRCRPICDKDNYRQKKMPKPMAVSYRRKTKKPKKIPLHQPFFPNEHRRLTRRYRKNEAPPSYNLLTPFTCVMRNINEIATKTITYMKQFIDCDESNDSDSQRS